MMTMKVYLSTALNPKAWGEKSATISESPKKIRPFIGPEDFASVIAISLSIVLLFVVMMFGEFKGKYPFHNHFMFLVPVFLLSFSAMGKLSSFEHGTSIREINIGRIVQCANLWLHGASTTFYLVKAFA